MSEELPATAATVGLPWVMVHNGFGDDLPGEYFAGVENSAGERVCLKGVALAHGNAPDAMANTEYMVMAVNSYAALVAENERLRQSLNEVVTNGMWAAVSSLYDANGEPVLDWVIATEVYEMACDALESPT